MPTKTLVVTKRARKQSRKLPANIKKKFAPSLLAIKSNPLAGVKLKGVLANYHKYIIGDYRIVYRFDKKTKTVIILKIEHRRGVYK